MERDFNRPPGLCFRASLLLGSASVTSAKDFDLSSRHPADSVALCTHGHQAGWIKFARENVGREFRQICGVGDDVPDSLRGSRYLDGPFHSRD